MGLCENGLVAMTALIAGYFLNMANSYCSLATSLVCGLICLGICLYQWKFSSKNKIDSTLQALREKKRAETYAGNGYPRGWYFLEYSDRVKKGDVIHVHALGREFVIFRGQNSGQIGVLDAFCPHMGANLAVGGCVKEDHLVCPFHSWKFDVEGTCKDIPYQEGKSKKIPKSANAKKFHSTEYCGMICVYIGKDREELPRYALREDWQNEIDEGKVVYRGSWDAGEVKMNIQEFAENSADWAHFGVIHDKMMIPFTQLTIPFLDRWLRIKHIPGVLVGSDKRDAPKILEKEYGPVDPCYMYFLDDAELMWNGKEIQGSGSQAVISFCGPATINTFRFHVPTYGNILLFHTHLPRHEMSLHTRFHWYADPALPRLLVLYIVGLWIAQWGNDIEIWQNKIFEPKPCLVKGDGPVQKVRRWWRQFVIDEDPSLKLKAKKKVVVSQENDEEDWD